VTIAASPPQDMIDEAILRPGRLEIHIEITLPDESGRVQILNIKTMEMKKSGRINPEVLERIPGETCIHSPLCCTVVLPMTLSMDYGHAELARMTKNYTGAELEGESRVDFIKSVRVILIES